MGTPLLSVYSSSCTLRLLVFFLLVQSVFVSMRSLRDGDFEGASWLLFLGTQRSWYGFGRLPGHARFQLRLLALPADLRIRFFLKFPNWLFLNYGKAPGSHRGTEGMAMAALPCCPRPFVLDRAVKEDACHTSDVVPLCPCTVMYSQRSSRPQPMVSGGDATPCKVTREDRRLYRSMCRCRLSDRNLSGV